MQALLLNYLSMLAWAVIKLPYYTALLCYDYLIMLPHNR
jgi:hypothetical protein